MKNLIIILLLSIAWRVNAQDNTQQDSVRKRYLAEQKLISKKFTNQFYPNYTRIHQLPEKIFVAKIDSAANNFYSLLNTYQNRLSADYVSAQRFEIKMYFDKILIEYPNIHEIYTNERRLQYPIIEKKVKDNLQLFNDEALITNDDLGGFISSFLNYKINGELSKPAYRGLYNKRLYAMWNILPRYFTNRPCKINQEYQLLFYHTTHNGIRYTDKLYREFKRYCSDTALVAKLEKVYRNSRNDLNDHRIYEYKRIGNYGLDIHVFQKGTITKNARKPAIVFFHGGSWSEGQPSWHFAACRKYAENGWVACAVEYRIYGTQGTLPFAAVKDARSAIRWLRAHGKELGIDTGRIVATGNSADGHLALAAAMAKGCNEKTDNLKFSAAPNVVMANSGVYDLTDEKTAWIRKGLKNSDSVKQISPNFLVTKHMPPTLIIHSVVDQNVPYATAQKFSALMQAAGNRYEFKSLSEGGHFIFDDPRYTSQVFAWRKAFLDSLKYPKNDGE
ncbi:MAG: alpha/beta hydrolase [Mucilaginibacter sp.]